MNGRQKPCDEVPVFQAVMEQVLGAHARYLEIFFDDANNPPFQPILLRMQATLRSYAADATK